MITFKACFGGIKVDKEGEAKITFIVPQSEVAKAISLSVIPETVFDVKVDPEVKDNRNAEPTQVSA